MPSRLLLPPQFEEQRRYRGNGMVRRLQVNLWQDEGEQGGVSHDSICLRNRPRQDSVSPSWP